MPKTATSDIAARVVGEEIRTARRKADISQVELAHRLGVTGGYVASVEAGRYNLTIGQLMNFASALGATLDIKLDIPVDEPITVEPPTAPPDRAAPRPNRLRLLEP